MNGLSYISFENGASKTTLTKWDEVKEQIIFYISTDVGAYFGDAEYGGGISKFRFRPVNNKNASALQNAITMLLLNKMPYVSVDSFNYSNEGGVVKITLGITILNESGEVEFQI
jgi:phage baseplate assembly protein W